VRQFEHAQQRRVKKDLALIRQLDAFEPGIVVEQFSEILEPKEPAANSLTVDLAGRRRARWAA